MATAVQQRRGTSAQHDDGDGFTGLEGEITVDTTNDTIRVHDNSTKGGHRLAKYSELGATITASDESSDTTCFPVFTTAATGALAPKTDESAYTYNASTGTLSVAALNVNGTVTADGLTVDGTPTFNVGTNALSINSTGDGTALNIKTNTTIDNNAPDLQFQRSVIPNRTNVGQTFHRIGEISYVSKNSNDDDYDYVKLRAVAGKDTDGQEQGTYDIFVANGTGNAFGAGGHTEHSFTKDGLDVTGTVTADAYTGSQTISNYVTDTAIDVTEFASYVGKKIIYTGAASTISLPNVVAADIGKSWTIVNAGTGVITIDVDASGTAQQVRHAHAGGVNTSTTDRTIAIGGVVEIICIAEDSSGITNSSDKPNYLIYGGGVI